LGDFHGSFLSKIAALQRASARAEAIVDLAGSCLPGYQTGGERQASIDIRRCAMMWIGALWSLQGARIAIETLSDGSTAYFVDLDHVQSLQAA
jgi:hypothetical protein